MENDIGQRTSIPVEVDIRPWAEGDFQLLLRMNTEPMWAHLGGPETEEAVIARHMRYLSDSNLHMFAIMLGTEVTGSVGYWARQWRDRQVFEVGWRVLPEFQGRGIATRAMSELLNVLRADVVQATVYAFPSIHNHASNAICRKLGFSFIAETDFEYPRGKWVKSNEWCRQL